MARKGKQGHSRGQPTIFARTAGLFRSQVSTAFPHPARVASHSSLSLLTSYRSFAYMEMNLILAKMFWSCDLELVNKDVDWEGESHMHVMWWKPELKVRFLAREVVPSVQIEA